LQVQSSSHCIAVLLQISRSLPAASLFNTIPFKPQIEEHNMQDVLTATGFIGAIPAIFRSVTGLQVVNALPVLATELIQAAIRVV